MKVARIHKRWIHNLLIVGIVVSLSACASDLKQNLSEKQADEILVALKERGINAKKEMVKVNRDISFSVTAPRTKLSEARRTLVILGLPRAKMIGIEDICGKTESLIPSPAIDRCKFQLALQNEIVRAILAIDGVVDAKVNVNMPEEKVLSEDQQTRPTAAVLIKFIPDESGRAPFEEKQIREYVANSVDNLDYNDVSILATSARSIDNILKIADKKSTQESQEVAKAEVKQPLRPQGPNQIFGMDVAYHSVKKFKIFVLFVTVLFLVLGGGIIVSVLQIRKVKAANDRLVAKQRRMRLQAQKILKPAGYEPPPEPEPVAGQSIVPAAPGQSEVINESANFPMNPPGVN